MKYNYTSKGDGVRKASGVRPLDIILGLSIGMALAAFLIF